MRMSMRMSMTRLSYEKTCLLKDKGCTGTQVGAERDQAAYFVEGGTTQGCCADPLRQLDCSHMCHIGRLPEACTVMVGRSAAFHTFTLIATMCMRAS